MDKQKIIKLLKKYGEQNDGCIDLSGADFSGLCLDFSEIKARLINNDKQTADEITNTKQTANQIDNTLQEGERIHNYEQIAGLFINNRDQKSRLIVNKNHQAEEIYNHDHVADRICNLYQIAELIDNSSQISKNINNIDQELFNKIHFNIGKYNRHIPINYIEDFIFKVGCFEGTAEELKIASIDKYGLDNNPYSPIIDDYFDNLERLKNENNQNQN